MSVSHGTLRGYRDGCRCDLCAPVEANRARRQREKRHAATCPSCTPESAATCPFGPRRRSGVPAELAAPLPGEEWRPIPGEAYEASSAGRVRRALPGRGTYVGRMRKQFLNKAGYYETSLPTGARASRPVQVHALVAAAFLGPRFAGMTVNHKDGVKTNNAPSNLEYVTQIENVEHATRTGLVAFGVRNGQAKLTEDDVIEIRRACAAGATRRSLGQAFGVSPHHVSNIVNRRHWKRVA